MKTHLALLSALVPLAALVGGCGGGNSGVPQGTPIPAPTFVGPSTGTPNFSTITVPETLLRLPGGEIGLLNLKRTGGSIDGNLRVLSGFASPDSLAAGIYPVSGVLSAPTAFSVESQGVGAGAVKFTLSGNLSTDSNRGNVTFTRGKFSAPSAVPNPDNGLVPSTSLYRASGNITYSDVKSLLPNDYSPNQFINFVPVTPTGSGAFLDRQDLFDLNGLPRGGEFVYITRNNATAVGLRATATRASVGQDLRERLYVNISLGGPSNTRPFSVGQSFDLPNSLSGSNSNTDSVNVRFDPISLNDYHSTGGRVTIRDINAESIVLELSNVVVATTRVAQGFINGKAAPTDGSPTGSVTLNGTFTVTGLNAIFKNQ